MSASIDKRLTLLEEAHAAQRNEIASLKKTIASLRSTIDGGHWRAMEDRVRALESLSSETRSLRLLARALNEFAHDASDRPYE